MLATILVITGILLSIAGLVGCALPVLPGPPLNWLALLCLSAAYAWEPFSGLTLAWTGAAAIGVTILDYVVPARGAAKAGAGRPGVWGSVLGMIVGMVAFPPFGMFLGAFGGALIGELTFGKTAGASTKAAFGVLKGILFGTVLKLLVSLVLTWYFVKGILDFWA